MSSSAAAQGKRSAEKEEEREQQEVENAGERKNKKGDADEATEEEQRQQQQRRNVIRYGVATWPDPLAEPHSRAKVDDISRLNSTSVERVLQPRTVEDIKVALAVAVKEGRQVSVRGTQVCYPHFSMCSLSSDVDVLCVLYVDAVSIRWEGIPSHRMESSSTCVTSIDFSLTPLELW